MEIFALIFHSSTHNSPHRRSILGKLFAWAGRKKFLPTSREHTSAVTWDLRRNSTGLVTTLPPFARAELISSPTWHKSMLQRGENYWTSNYREENFQSQSNHRSTRPTSSRFSCTKISPRCWKCNKPSRKYSENCSPRTAKRFRQSSQSSPRSWRGRHDGSEFSARGSRSELRFSCWAPWVHRQLPSLSFSSRFACRRARSTFLDICTLRLSATSFSRDNVILSACRMFHLKRERVSRWLVSVSLCCKLTIQST